MKSYLRLIVAAALLVLCAVTAVAQTSNGTIAGVVTDPSNAVVLNAKVVAKSTLTGELREGTTNANGAYRLESLGPGLYTVTISAKGFSTTTIQNVEVKATVVTPLNAEIKLGGTSETIEVEAAAQQIQTENGELSHTISEAEVDKLPIASLNPYSLATTMPGVLTVSGGTSAMTNGTAFSVNGNRPRANNFLIEGQDNNDAGIHGQGLQPGNLDAVKEVSILTNSYSAEFGNGGGSVSNLIFKSGTNQFHGSAWDLLQNSSLNANDHYNNYYARQIEKDKFRENTFGFSLGGPIKKDKLFIYGSYQWDKYRAGATGSTLTLPTPAGYAALQALLPNPRIQQYLTAIGSMRGDPNNTPNSIDLGNGRGTAQFANTNRTGIAANSDAPEYDLKGDYLITKNDTLNLRYIHNKYSTPYDLGNFPDRLPGFDTNQDGAAHNAGLTYTKVFTPTIVNELRASYGRIGFTFALRPDTLSNPLAMGPTVSISGITGWGIYPGTVPQGRFHNTYQLQDALSWSKGNHLFKFGFDYADIRVVDTIPFNWNGTLTYGASTARGTTPAYTGLANFIDDFGGDASNGAARTFGSNILHAYFKKQAYYFQDTWKMRPNFTLSAGVRYEYEGSPANILPYPAIDVNNVNPANFPNRVPQKADTNNFAPRVSFAYTPDFWKGMFGDNKTVIRAGYGMFYDGMFTNILDNNASSSPIVVSPAVTSALSTANPRGRAAWSSAFANLSTATNPLNSQTTIRNDLILPLIHQWNLDIQRDLPGQFVLTTGYVGTRGTHLYGQNMYNPNNPLTPGLRIIPTRGAILVRDNSGDSIYHALNVKLDRQFRHGFLFRTSYTWSKNIDDVSEVFTSGNFSAYPMIQNPGTRAIDRGLSAYDRRNRLVFSYVYDIPKWNAEGALKGLAYVVNNWEFSGTTTFQSGSPANVQTGYDTNRDGITNDRPALGNPQAPLTSWAWDGSWDGQPGILCDGPKWWVGPCVPVSASSVHWIVPPSGTNSTLGRNNMTTPGFSVWNFSAMRTIKITERHQIEFRSELFNIFNHGNSGMPNTTLISGTPMSYKASTNTFTQGTWTLFDLGRSVSGNRSIRFWLKYQF